MGCNCSGKAATFQVRYSNGRTRAFLTLQEAKVAAAASPGASIVTVTR